MPKQATVKIHVWPASIKSKDKWKCAVDRPGNGGVSYLKGNYTRATTAKRAGHRNLKAECINGVWSCLLPKKDGYSRYFIDVINAKPAK